MAVKIEVVYDGSKRILDAEEQLTLWHALVDAGVGESFYCGGKGLCGKCAVVLRAGKTEPNEKERQIFSDEQLAAGFRLACQTMAHAGMLVELRRNSMIRGFVDGLDVAIPLAPAVEQTQVVVEDQDGLRDRVCGLREQLGPAVDENWDLPGLASIPKGQKAIVTHTDDIVLHVEPKAAGHEYRLLGAAVDVGTTTLAFYLRDLKTGQLLAAVSSENPQRRYGADVISRVAYTQSHSDGVDALQQTLVKAINQGVGQLVDQTAIHPLQISHMVLAGNTIMLHTLLGISAASIAHSPFTPTFTSGQRRTAQQLGFTIHPNALVETLPSLSGYVGADITADLLAVKAAGADEETYLLMDIGTNGEVVLHHDGRFWACATAAGPAFEGASISCGLPGVDGAIAKVWRHRDGALQYEVLGDVAPQGLCGSGLIDAVAQLRRDGIVEATGAFADEKQDGMGTIDGRPAYQLVPDSDLWLTQKDVRELQLAKGAMAAGVQLLLKEAGVQEDQVDKVFLAGGFGQYLDAASAAGIGLIPASWVDKVVKVGNGSGLGAQIYMLNRHCHEYTAYLPEHIQYVELSTRPDFQQFFMEAMML